MQNRVTYVRAGSLVVVVRGGMNGEESGGHVRVALKAMNEGRILQSLDVAAESKKEQRQSGFGK